MGERNGRWDGLAYVQIYPKGTSKSSIHPVVPCMSIVFFVEHMSGGFPPYVRTTDSSVRFPTEDQCLAFIL
jgi:hypothetical protein